MKYLNSGVPVIYFLLIHIAFLLLPGLSANAQVEQTRRYELPKKMSDEYFTVISLEEDGLALVRERNKYDGNRKLWEIIVLDDNLEEKSKTDLPVNQRNRLLGYEIDENRLFLLYRTGETTRNSLELIGVDTRTGKETVRYEINPELDFRITHFNKVARNIIFGGYVSNEPAILLYAPTDNSIKVLPGFFQKDNELVELRVNENNTFNVVLMDRSTRALRKIVYKTFDANGELLLEDIVSMEEDKTLQSSLSSTLKREELMLLGTWGDKQGKQSLGFYSLAVDPFAEQKINYQYFGTMDHFLDYLNPKRAKKIRESTRDALNNGRRPSFTTYAMPFRIEENREGFIMLAEVYNASSNRSPYYNSPYGRPYYGNPYYYYNPFWPGYYPGMRMYRPYGYGDLSRNSDNVKLYASVVAAFDAKGDLIWDHGIVLDNVKRPALEQVSDFYTDGRTLYLLYKKESELRIKQITLDSGNATETTQEIKLTEPADEIRSEKEYEDGVRHWVGNTFYTWGYQTIRNQEKKSDRVRDVFYINKIVVH